MLVRWSMLQTPPLRQNSNSRPRSPESKPRANLRGRCSTPLTDTTGFVTIDYTRKMIVVAFRGTQAIQNFIDDVTFAQIPVDLCLGCLVHRGFWNSWLEIRETVLTAVSIETAEHPDFQVVVAGHSLGGAIASITAATLRKAGTSAALVSNARPTRRNTFCSERHIVSPASMANISNSRHSTRTARPEWATRCLRPL